MQSPVVSSAAAEFLQAKPVRGERFKASESGFSEVLGASLQKGAKSSKEAENGEPDSTEPLVNASAPPDSESQDPQTKALSLEVAESEPPAENITAEIEASSETTEVDVQKILVQLMDQYQNTPDFETKEKLETKIELLLNRVEKQGQAVLSEDTRAFLATIRENMQNPELLKALQAGDFTKELKQLNDVVRQSLETALVEKEGRAQQKHPIAEPRTETASEQKPQKDRPTEESAKQKQPIAQPPTEETASKQNPQTEDFDKPSQAASKSEALKLKNVRMQVEQQGSTSEKPQSEPQSHLRQPEDGSQDALNRLVLRLDKELKQDATPATKEIEAPNSAEKADVVTKVMSTNFMGGETSQDSNHPDRRSEAWQRVLLSLQKHEVSAERLQKLKPEGEGMETVDMQKTSKTVSTRVLRMPVFRSSSQQVVQQVVETMKEIRPPQVTRIQMVLRPQNLGEVRAQLKLQEGQLRVQIDVENNVVREVLEKSAPQLREALRTSGLDKAEIEVRQRDESRGESEASQDHEQEKGSRRFKRGFGSPDPQESENESEELESVIPQAGLQGRLNQYI